MQTEITPQRTAASIEMEEAVGSLLNDSFEIIEQDQVEGQDLEAGCLSCS